MNMPSPETEAVIAKIKASVDIEGEQRHALYLQSKLKIICEMLNKVIAESVVTGFEVELEINKHSDDERVWPAVIRKLDKWDELLAHVHLSDRIGNTSGA